MSNLSKQQLSYAANDIYVTCKLAEKIQMIQAQKPTNPTNGNEYMVPTADIMEGGTDIKILKGTLHDIISSNLSDRVILKQYLTLLNKSSNNNRNSNNS